MAKLTHEDILAYLEEATILELNDLVKAIEEKFDVTAAAPVAVAAAAARIVQRVDYWFEGRPDEQDIRIEFVDFEAEWVIGAVLLIAVEIEKLANSPSGLKLFEDIVVPYNYELEKMMD